MPARLAVAGDDDAENDWNEGKVGGQGLRLPGEAEGEETGEDGSGGPYGLVEGNWDVAEGHVAEHDGEAEYGSQCDDLHQLL